MSSCLLLTKFGQNILCLWTEKTEPFGFCFQVQKYIILALNLSTAQFYGDICFPMKPRLQERKVGSKIAKVSFSETRVFAVQFYISSIGVGQGESSSSVRYIGQYFLSTLLAIPTFCLPLLHRRFTTVVFSRLFLWDRLSSCCLLSTAHPHTQSLRLLRLHLLLKQRSERKLAQFSPVFSCHRMPVFWNHAL